MRLRQRLTRDEPPGALKAARPIKLTLPIGRESGMTNPALSVSGHIATWPRTWPRPWKESFQVR